PGWQSGQLQQLGNMCGHYNVFISDYSRKKWNINHPNQRVIHHGINTDEFIITNQQRKMCCLSVVNDFINRDWCCGFSEWQEITKAFPTHIVGNTPGLSAPASSIEHLVDIYNTNLIYANTSKISPVPTALLEAMS